jgi:hypothetical protein
VVNQSPAYVELHADERLHRSPASSAGPLRHLQEHATSVSRTLDTGALTGELLQTPVCDVVVAAVHLVRLDARRFLARLGFIGSSTRRFDHAHAVVLASSALPKQIAFKLVVSHPATEVQQEQAGHAVALR